MILRRCFIVLHTASAGESANTATTRIASTFHATCTYAFIIWSTTSRSRSLPFCLLSTIMSLRRFPPTNRNSEAYTSNVTTVPTHNLSGRDPESAEYSHADTLGAVGASQATSNSSYSKRPSENQFPPRFLIYVNFLFVSWYYRIYAEDGALPSKTLVAHSDPFIGRIKVRSAAASHCQSCKTQHCKSGEHQRPWKH